MNSVDVQWRLARRHHAPEHDDASARPRSRWPGVFRFWPPEEDIRALATWTRSRERTSPTAGAAAVAGLADGIHHAASRMKALEAELGRLTARFEALHAQLVRAANASRPFARPSGNGDGPRPARLASGEHADGTGAPRLVGR